MPTTTKATSEATLRHFVDATNSGDAERISQAVDEVLSQMKQLDLITARRARTHRPLPEATA
jgi:hypothetical protein